MRQGRQHESLRAGFAEAGVACPSSGPQHSSGGAAIQRFQAHRGAILVTLSGDRHSHSRQAEGGARSVSGGPHMKRRSGVDRPAARFDPERTPATLLDRGCGCVCASPPSGTGRNGWAGGYKKRRAVAHACQSWFQPSPQPHHAIGLARDGGIATHPPATASSRSSKLRSHIQVYG